MTKNSIILVCFTLLPSFCMAQKFIGKAKEDKYIREALKEIIQEAKNGNAESQYVVGMHYLSGVMIERDSIAGWNWLEKSRKGDYAKAYEEFGDFEKDDNAAISYYKQAILKAKATDRFPVSADEINQKIYIRKTRK